MKRVSKFLALGLVALVLLTYGAVTAFSSGTAAAQDPAPDSLSVSGQGKVSIKPDMAYITVGVNTEAKTAREAQTQNNQQMNKVVGTLKDLGIAESDIQTVNYNLSPRYDYINLKNGGGRQVLAGYTVYNQVRVTVKDINAVGKTLDAVITAGANLSGGVSFTLSDSKMEKAYADALTAALKNAEGKARVLAAGLNVTLGKPKEVVEGGAAPRPVLNRAMYDAAKTMEAEVPISAGEMEVSASVNLRYEY